jgi:hypothetical protein
VHEGVYLPEVLDVDHANVITDMEIPGDHLLHHGPGAAEQHPNVETDLDVSPARVYRRRSRVQRLALGSRLPVIDDNPMSLSRPADTVHLAGESDTRC